MPAATKSPKKSAGKAAAAAIEQLPSASTRGAVTGMLLRFVSCGVLCLLAGLLWRLRGAPTLVDVASSLGSLLILLSGFIVGGVLWYIRDVRLRNRHPQRITDERIVFSFIVFTLVPLAVMLLVGMVWLGVVLLG